MTKRWWIPTWHRILDGCNYLIKENTEIKLAILGTKKILKTKQNKYIVRCTIS
jgi:hypothetical protein